MEGKKNWIKPEIKLELINATGMPVKDPGTSETASSAMS